MLSTALLSVGNNSLHLGKQYCFETYAPRFIYAIMDHWSINVQAAFRNQVITTIYELLIDKFITKLYSVHIWEQKVYF